MYFPNDRIKAAGYRVRHGMAQALALERLQKGE
jgi:hypothetical protein